MADGKIVERTPLVSVTEIIGTLDKLLEELI